MKSSWLAKILLFSLLPIFTDQINAQDLAVYKMIGKNINEVISKYGKPVHQDRSNPAMECIFYKTKTSQKVFVAGKKIVFQAEGSFCYTNKSKAVEEILNLVSDTEKNGFKVDTLNATEYLLYRNNAKVNLSLFENSFSKKYEVKIKANKTMGMK